MAFSDGVPNRQQRTAQFESWVRDVRDPARSASEGIRRLIVEGAAAEYEIAPLNNDRWAIRMHVAYSCGNSSGQGCPWRELRSREACVETFLSTAREHFGRTLHEHDTTVNDRQRRARRAMQELLDGGLFNFIEPRPEPLDSSAFA